MVKQTRSEKEEPQGNVKAGQKQFDGPSPGVYNFIISIALKCKQPIPAASTEPILRLNVPTRPALDF
ncbi:hypothetical protein V6N13_032406 [Hibiscus sabdariffa]